MSDISSSPVHPSSSSGGSTYGGGNNNDSGCAVIYEIFDSYNSLGYKQMLSHLDNAIRHRNPFIVIESDRLGKETKNWIEVGNIIRHSAWISGLGSCIALIAREEPICVPLGIYSALATCLHMRCWQPDPCSRYKVLRDKDALAGLLQIYREEQAAAASEGPKEVERRQLFFRDPIVLALKKDPLFASSNTLINLCGLCAASAVVLYTLKYFKVL